MMPFWYATKAPSPLSPHWRHRHEDGPDPQPRQDSRDACDRWIRFHRLQLREAEKSEERQERHLHFPGEVCPTEDSEPPEVHNVATSTDQPEGIRGDGQSDSDGVGKLLPAHERQPSFPCASSLRQYPFSPVLDPTQ